MFQKTSKSLEEKNGFFCYNMLEIAKNSFSYFLFAGLLITFIELIKNRNYNFWSHEFVQCAPEIQKLFESVARSCMVHSPPRIQPGHDQPNPTAAVQPVGGGGAPGGVVGAPPDQQAGQN